MQMETVPAGFTQVTVTFEQDDEVLATLQIPYDGTVTEEEVPDIEPDALGCLLDVPHIFQCIQKTMARAFLDAEGRRHIGDRHIAALHDVLEYLQPPLKGQDAGRV